MADTDTYKGPIKSVNTTAPGIEPVQNGYKIIKSDLYSDNTGRSSETGQMLRYIIRSGVVSIELQYEGTEAEISSIEALYSSNTLSVQFRDNGEYVTKSFYPSDRAKDVESLKNQGRVRFAVSLVEI